MLGSPEPFVGAAAAAATAFGGWKAASGIKGLLFGILSSMLFMECVGSVECMQFVFLVSILVLPGISCDKLDGWLIA